MFLPYQCFLMLSLYSFADFVERKLIYLLCFFFSAPPSYNECVFGKVNVKEEDDNEHTRGALDFAPVYTYYDWGYQPTTMNGK